MTSKLVVLTLFGAGTIAAAAVGGYSALRQNTAEAPAATLQTDVAVKPADAIADAPAAAAAPQPVVVDVPEPAPAKTTPAPRAQAKATKAAAPKAAPAAKSSNAPVPASNAPAAPAPAPAPAEAPRAETPDARPEPVSVAAAEPAKPEIEELTIARDSVIGIRLESAVSSQTAKVEDKVVARVARDVTVDGRTALSSGSRLEGVVASVDRGGKFKDRARVGIRFHSLVLADNTRLPIDTETIFRESDSPTTQAATKVGASAAIGGILGAVLGGKKGAAIGSTVGAAGGAATVAAGAAPDASLAAGTPLTVRLTAPVTLSVERPRD
jgi:hypothetical protein